MQTKIQQINTKQSMVWGNLVFYNLFTILAGGNINILVNGTFDTFKSIVCGYNIGVFNGFP